MPGKATQRPGDEMYILLTEPGVHEAHVAANHTDIKAQWFNQGMKNLTEDMQHYETTWFSFRPSTCLNVSFDYDKDVELFDQSRKLALLW